MNDHRDRVPPYSNEAEQAVLGSVLLKNDLMPLILGIVTEADFYNEAHKLIFIAMIETRQAGKVIDAVTIGERMKESGKLEKIGGAIALSKLEGGVVSSVTAEHYARIVAEKAAVRRMIYAGMEIVARGFGDYGDFDGYLSESRKSITAASAQLYLKNAPELINEDLGVIVSDLLEGKPPQGVIPTRFKKLDRLCGGLWAGLVHILAGRPGMGKSAWMLNLAINLGFSQLKTLYCSLEDVKGFQQRRALSRLADINLQRIVMSRVRAEDSKKLIEAQVTLDKMPIWIQDKPMTTNQVAQAATVQKETHGLDLLMIDHLGYVREKGKDEYDITSTVVRGCADMAKELDIPVVLGVQLNRKVTDRNPPIPRLSDLRGSGHIEQDARVVWFLYREYMTSQKEEDFNKMQLYIAKATHGMTGCINLWCDMGKMYVKDTPDDGLDGGPPTAQEDIGYN
jgi:replicative DNA helicase